MPSSVKANGNKGGGYCLYSKPPSESELDASPCGDLHLSSSTSSELDVSLCGDLHASSPTSDLDAYTYGSQYEAYACGGGAYPRSQPALSGYGRYGGQAGAQDKVATAAAPAASDWSEEFDPNTQRSYFFNLVTGATQWERPAEKP